MDLLLDNCFTQQIGGNLAYFHPCSIKSSRQLCTIKNLFLIDIPHYYLHWHHDISIWSLKSAKYIIMIGYRCLECRVSHDSVMMMILLMILLGNFQHVIRAIMQTWFCATKKKNIIDKLKHILYLCTQVFPSSNLLRKLPRPEKLRYMGHSFLADN